MGNQQRQQSLTSRTAASSGTPALPQGRTDGRVISPGFREPGLKKKTTTIRWTGFAAGLLAAVLLFSLLPDSMPSAARVTAATAALMGIWWMTEAIPIPATALIPLVVFPVFNGVDMSDVGGSYGSDTIFLFMGGFLIALSMQKWNLHRRIALFVLRVMGDRTNFMIAGFMISTGFLSMWVSNTATAVLMLPIGLSVLLLVNETMERSEEQSSLAASGDEKAAGASGAGDGGGSTASEQSEASGSTASGSTASGSTPPASGGDEDGVSDSVKDAVLKSNFGTALMLAIAYSASIGSLGTIIGTPPNIFLVGYLSDNHGIEIGFGQWMLVGVPIAVVMMVIAWFLLTKVLFRPEVQRIPGGRGLIDDELAKLGPMSRPEWMVLVIFALAALSWILIPVLFDPAPISDAGIAMTVGLILFILPAGAQRGVRLLDWDTAVDMPWGVLLLFGGGLALSGQFTDSGLTEAIGGAVEGIAGVPIILLVAVLVGAIIFLTEITSNTATAATFIPVVGGVALGIAADPLLLTVPVALAATCAFMLPVATPPNAVAFGTGYVSIAQMVKGGVWLNLISIVIITLAAMTLAVWAFGIVY
ncbi:SLC13 family permease [Brevibacterium jeotgali]|uniref:Sodium-dependent dicarboxylate transporter SdcS n=1 Tax=Brevibacterium jeotgali TaxID=1262550 RepID=A0A2H1L7U7_9MICO|nr:DASS family sodium-coupled anion symporter [Brevibacterium jeotgali]TWC03317.1 sodium-dependent dicarboxylate transporter 2/3/5 [Brevibacterium jeotgali]SMY12976.1 solute carrier family 13 (sodium-dependent dicarboxylate transporter), member 2/3/5 [Brevibacterium jeotgali]